MYVTPLTGKALSNTNQKQFLENLRKDLGQANPLREQKDEL